MLEVRKLAQVGRDSQLSGNSSESRRTCMGQIHETKTKLGFGS